MALFLGIDLGTSYFKAGLFDEAGTLKALGRKAVQKTSMRPGECELSLPTFWSMLQACINDALAMTGSSAKEVIGLSYSSQANSFVLLDANNEPLTPIILWTDTRVKELAHPLQQLSDREDFMTTTGIGTSLSPQMCIAKLLWYQKHQPALWKQVKRVLTISDYLAFALSGQAVSDASTAALTGLFNTQQGAWWDEALGAIKLPLSFLSSVQRTGTLVGKLTRKGAERIGLTSDTQICTGGLDHHIAAVGVGLLNTKNISESTGTVLASVRYTKSYDPRKNLFTAIGLDGEHFFQLSYTDNGAGALEWYQKKFAPELSISELLTRAADVTPGSEGLTAKACVAKYKDLEGFTNRQPFHQHGHYMRAILESTAVSLKEIIGQLSDKKNFQRVESTGGGAVSKLWIQIKADVLGKEFIIPQCSEAACLGGALLAAVSTGCFATVDEASTYWIKPKEIIEPDSFNHHFYTEWIQQQKQLNLIQ